MRPAPPRDGGTLLNATRRVLLALAAALACAPLAGAVALPSDLCDEIDAATSGTCTAVANDAEAACRDLVGDGYGVVDCAWIGFLFGQSPHATRSGPVCDALDPPFAEACGAAGDELRALCYVLQPGPSDLCDTLYATTGPFP